MGRKPVVKSFAHGRSSVITFNSPVQKCDRQPVKAQPCDRSVSNAACMSSDGRLIKTNNSVQLPENLRILDDVGANGLDLSRCGRIGKILATKEEFFIANRNFITGPSFTESFRMAALHLFEYSPNILIDAYSALLELMSDRGPQVIDLEGLDLTAGLRSLRAFTDASRSITCIEDAAVVILLGQILLAYNAIIPLGSSTRTITRSTLWSTKYWYPVMIQEPRLDAIIFTPILVDTIDSLIRRTVPVVRLPTVGRCPVDRLAGICSSLLPLLYDLCCRSSEARLSPELNGQAGSSLCDPYKIVEEQIAAWSPTYPSDFCRQFTISERDAMLAQARSYQTTLLLVIHRLRFPLGVEDSIAQDYAKSIIDFIAPLRDWSSDGATGLALDFPLLIAMVELPGQAGELFKAFEPLRYRKRQSDDMLNFIDSVNRARHSGFQGLWFDLVQNEFHGDILP